MVHPLVALRSHTAATPTLSELSMPCPRAMAIKRARYLVGTHPHVRGVDPTMFAAAVVSLLLSYPEEVVMAVTEPATCFAAGLRFPWKLSDLRLSCERHHMHIRALERGRAEAAAAGQRAEAAAQQRERAPAEIGARLDGLGFPGDAVLRWLQPHQVEWLIERQTDGSLSPLTLVDLAHEYRLFARLEAAGFDAAKAFRSLLRRTRDYETLLEKVRNDTLTDSELIESVPIRFRKPAAGNG
jgi:hypothetical protein